MFVLSSAKDQAKYESGPTFLDEELRIRASFWERNNPQMKLTAEQKKCISVVAHGLKRQLPEHEIIRHLLSFGLSHENAPKAFELIRHGIRSGVNAAVTNGLSAEQYKRGEFELYDAAFANGYRAFKNQMLLTWLRRLGIPIGILAVLLWLLLMR